MSDEFFAAGNVIEFGYPRHNFFGVLSKLEKRRMRIESVRLLDEKPLSEMTFEIQPLLRRSRVLVIGHDLDKKEDRSFYADSMQEIRFARSA